MVVNGNMAAFENCLSGNKAKEKILELILFTA
jgi:hypothetical protein